MDDQMELVDLLEDLEEEIEDEDNLYFFTINISSDPSAKNECTLAGAYIESPLQNVYINIVLPPPELV
jgi:hypothetical protein